MICLFEEILQVKANCSKDRIVYRKISLCRKHKSQAISLISIQLEELSLNRKEMMELFFGYSKTKREQKNKINRIKKMLESIKRLIAEYVQNDIKNKIWDLQDRIEILKESGSKLEAIIKGEDI